MERGINNWGEKFLLVVLLVMLLTPNIMAIGITPGRTTIDFEAGLEKEIEFKVINNEHKNMRVSLFSMMEDGLGSIILFEDYLDFEPSESEKILRYKIKLPAELTPGLHIGEIIAVETPRASEADTFVGATIAVVSQLYIYVPCPGKCIEADLEVLDHCNIYCSCKKQRTVRHRRSQSYD